MYDIRTLSSITLRTGEQLTLTWDFTNSSVSIESNKHESMLIGKWTVQLQQSNQDSFVLLQNGLRITCNTHGAAYCFAVGELRRMIGEDDWELIQQFVVKRLYCESNW